ncbi:four helix bundle protein [Opitutus sp. ER46]|uniref:four helix bundle protein n=1 Tax=Opitutus sp. ER46 TaxID=2161864 RepID=UPI000D3278DD|nr:four helix bundle protein [Opitutus sp. ER46]PTX98617.1 four helix bundle protein [Opitutus sp. ER46]
MFHEHGDLRGRTQQFALRVSRAFRSLPARDRVAQIWGEQLLRAAGSVGANYREAQHARSVAEYRSKLGDCLREADEALYWMENLESEQFFKPSAIRPLKTEASELIAILTTLLRKP